MSEDKVLRAHEKLQAIVNRFRAEHIANMQRGVTGPDLVRHITADVEALHELAGEVEAIESEHVAMGVSLENARMSENVGLAVSVVPPADVATSAPPTKKTTGK